MSVWTSCKSRLTFSLQHKPSLNDMQHQGELDGVDVIGCPGSPVQKETRIRRSHDPRQRDLPAVALRASSSCFSFPGQVSVLLPAKLHTDYNAQWRPRLDTSQI